MTYTRKEVIGNATLYLGDCMEVLPTLGKVDAVITDPPYGERTHAGYDTGSRSRKDGADRKDLGYKALTPEDAEFFAGEYARICTGWVVWMTDHTLASTIGKALEKRGRYVFAPLPFFAPGRSVRLSGDGPSSWTDWIVVARTKAQVKWGTLPGGYIAGSGWNDKARMGGKPTLLMEALVSDYSRPGQTVLDTHMGAGTTGVACIRTGRKFIGCEVDPEAFDLSCRRIEQAVAQGQLFAEPQPSHEQLALGVL
jgi:site-specific DNA-methyltransferase (adenine-specific)